MTQNGTNLVNEFAKLEDILRDNWGIKSLADISNSVQSLPKGVNRAFIYAPKAIDDDTITTKRLGKASAEELSTFIVMHALASTPSRDSERLRENLALSIDTNHILWNKNKKALQESADIATSIGYLTNVLYKVSKPVEPKQEIVKESKQEIVKEPLELEYNPSFFERTLGYVASFVGSLGLVSTMASPLIFPLVSSTSAVFNQAPEQKIPNYESSTRFWNKPLFPIFNFTWSKPVPFEQTEKKEINKKIEIASESPFSSPEPNLLISLGYGDIETIPMPTPERPSVFTMKPTEIPYPTATPTITQTPTHPTATPTQTNISNTEGLSWHEISEMNGGRAPVGIPTQVPTIHSEPKQEPTPLEGSIQPEPVSVPTGTYTVQEVVNAYYRAGNNSWKYMDEDRIKTKGKISMAILSQGRDSEFTQLDLISPEVKQNLVARKQAELERSRKPLAEKQTLVEKLDHQPTNQEVINLFAGVYKDNLPVPDRASGKIKAKWNTLEETLTIPYGITLDFMVNHKHEAFVDPYLLPNEILRYLSNQEPKADQETQEVIKTTYHNFRGNTNIKNNTQRIKKIAESTGVSTYAVEETLLAQRYTDNISWSTKFLEHEEVVEEIKKFKEAHGNLGNSKKARELFTESTGFGKRNGDTIGYREYRDLMWKVEAKA